MATATKFVFGVVNSAYTKGAIGTCLSNGTQKTVALKKYGGSSNDFGGDPHVLALNKNVTISGSTCYAGTVVSNYTYSTTPYIWARGEAVYGMYDGLTFGSPKKLAKSDNETSFSTTNIWNATNPYSLVMGTNYFYINDYDMHTANTGSIYQIKASDFTQKLEYYSLTDTNYQRCSCVALNEYNGMLLALFIRSSYDSNTNQFSYGNSTLVLLPKNETTTSAVTALASVNCTANASTITVSDNYVYVTSYGGVQTAGGNSTSRIQVIQITQSGSTYSMSVKKTISPTKLPSGTSYGQNGNFMGVEIVTGSDNNKYAVVLVAKYNSAWTQYQYELVRTLESNLRAGNLNNPNYLYGTVGTPGATWGLIKDKATGELFLANGVGILKVNATTSTVSVTSITVASDYAINSTTSGHVLNTVTYNAHVAVSKDGITEICSIAEVPAGTVQTVIHPHLTREEIKLLRKQ